MVSFALLLVAGGGALALLGFTHEPGFEYELRVRVSTVENAPARGASRSGGGLEGPVWRLRRLGQEQVDAGRGVTARFENGRVAGVSGCNQYTGRYERRGESLVLGPLAGTMMACPDPVMALEGAFRGAFSGTVAYKTEGERLVVTGAGGVTLLFEIEPPDTLEDGPWEVTGYDNGKQAVASPLLGTSLTMAFRQGRLSGSGGCNSYSASYTAHGERLTVGPAAATRKACPTDVMDQEERFLAALARVRTWRAQGGTLELRTETGALAVSSRARDR
jgi:heat shock protein HslJ